MSEVEVAPTVTATPGTKDQKMRVAMVTWSEMGCVIPLSQLAEGLVERGHEVYFITNSDAYSEGKVANQINQVEKVNLIHTDDGITKEQWEAPPKSMSDSPMLDLMLKWKPLVQKEIKKINPNMIVGEFYTGRVGINIADEMNIPSVVSLQGVLSFWDQYGVPGIINLKRASVCCGQVCVQENFEICSARAFTKNQSIVMYDYFESLNTRVVLYNSFFGLDPALSIPPNYVMTGPMSKPQNDLLERLGTKDAELLAWLDEAQSNNQAVVYVSLGSVCKWKQWSIDAIFNGLKKLGCRVIWSLKGFQTPDDNDTNFWIRPWLPQIELLAHPAVKAGLCHCGFGGTLEFIAAGKPVVAWPHFGDQLSNAAQLVEGGQAIYLAKRESDQIDFDPTTACVYNDQVFDEEKVYEIFKSVTENETYQHNMTKLQKIQKATGGRKLACETIEKVYEVGSDHLIDKTLVERNKSLNCCLYCLFKFMMLCVTAALVTFSVLYFVSSSDSQPPAVSNDGV